jgi:hypothetical protein
MMHFLWFFRCLGRQSAAIRETRVDQPLDPLDDISDNQATATECPCLSLCCRRCTRETLYLLRLFKMTNDVQQQQVGSILRRA